MARSSADDRDSERVPLLAKQNTTYTNSARPNFHFVGHLLLNFNIYRNNKLEFQSDNKLLELLQIPPEYEEILTVGTFDENELSKNIKACEWLTQAIHKLELLNMDPRYIKMRAVKEKRAKFILLRCAFVRRASEFLQKYFPSVIDSMMKDKNKFSQKGDPIRPDHSDLRCKCRIYARLIQQIKSLDKTCMISLRKSYCHALNQLLRKEVNEFGSKVRATIRAVKHSGINLEGEGPLPAVQATDDTSTISEAYSKMIRVFIPLFADEVSFFAHFMCFEVASGSKQRELAMLDECLEELFKGIEDEFFHVIDCALKKDQLSCTSMLGNLQLFETQIQNSGSSYVLMFLFKVEKKISTYFNKLFNDECDKILKYEENNGQPPFGVLPYIPRFGQLAHIMEEHIHGQSRDWRIDMSYLKVVTVLFSTLQKLAQKMEEPKYSDIFLLENYAAFQNGLYELANKVPTAAKYYHRAGESYEQACLRYINMVIYMHFEKLFQFAKRIETLLLSYPPEDVLYQHETSTSELRKVFKHSLSEVDNKLFSMYKTLENNLTTKELFPSLWDKCKKEFMDKYTSLLKMVQKIYPNEIVFTAVEMSNLIANLPFNNDYLENSSS